MKNLLKIIGAITLLLFVSCKKDSDMNDSDTGNLESRMVGQWDYKLISNNSYSAPQDNSTTEEENGIITFNSDGTGRVVESDGEYYNFTWSSSNEESLRMIDLDENGEPIAT